MKLFFSLLVFLLLFNCNKADDCLDIRNKYIGNGQYYFELNDSGVLYIYMAFAENPFKYSPAG